MEIDSSELAGRLVAPADIPPERAIVFPKVERIDKSRLTVVEKVYFHRPNMGGTVEIEGSYSLVLETVDMEVYARRMRASKEWKTIDYGWLDDDPDYAKSGLISMIVIANQTGRNLIAKPTPEQQKEIDDAIVEVRFVGDDHAWIIPPGESMRARPDGRLEIRSRLSDASVMIHAIPV